MSNDRALFPSMAHSWSRRRFLKQAAGAGLGAWWSLRDFSERAHAYRVSRPRSDANFNNRPFIVPGERYTLASPDTLDLQARANRAINALTRMAQPDHATRVYTYSFISRRPPVLGQPESFVGKYYEALAMMRLLTGSQVSLLTDQRWRRAFLEWFAESHLVMHGPDLGRILAWMTVAYRVEQDPMWRTLAQDALGFMRNKLTVRDDYGYFAGEDGSMPTGWDATYAGWTLQGLVQVCAVMQLPLAYELAGRLARYLKDHAQVFDDQGRFLARHAADNGSKLHFHHNGNVLVGLAEYADVCRDADHAAFVRQGYAWARSLGSPLVGFFPEYIDDPPGSLDLIDCETCCTADMIQLALRLTACGQGDYWDDVDCYLRNQFAEMQLLDGAWIDPRAAGLPPTPVGANETADQVSQRIEGAFAGWSSANDFIAHEGAPGVSFCCLGNAARALYFVWEQMIQVRQRVLTVHLLLNRPSHWADIHSCLPVEGRAELHIKRACRLRVRLPDWVAAGEAGCTVDGAPHTLTYAGRYVETGQVQAGQTAAITFPIAERTVAATIGRQPYTVVVRGHDVVAIDPAGVWNPFYQRAQQRTAPAQWVERERFIADVYDRHVVCLPAISS